MFVSKTDTTMSVSNVTSRITRRTALSNSSISPSTYRHRHTERHIHREKYKDTYRETYRGTHTETYRGMDIYKETETDN